MCGLPLFCHYLTRCVTLAIVSAWDLVLWTSLLYRQRYIVSLSSDKCTSCKLLWIEESAKRPKCKCNSSKFSSHSLFGNDHLWESPFFISFSLFWLKFGSVIQCTRHRGFVTLPNLLMNWKATDSQNAMGRFDVVTGMGHFTSTRLSTGSLTQLHTRWTAFWKRYTNIFPLSLVCIHRLLFCFYSLISGIHPGIFWFCSFLILRLRALLPRGAESMLFSQSTKYWFNARKFASNTESSSLECAQINLMRRTLWLLSLFRLPGVLLLDLWRTLEPLFRRI